MGTMRFFCFFSALFVFYEVPAQTPPALLNVGGDRLALGGYDVVSYYANAPKKGTKEHVAATGGAAYRFFSAENKEKFLRNPEQYLPQYGGWCAYAMGATGKKVEVNPESYKILEGKLYLFYNKYWVNTLKKWNANETALRKQADANWSALVAKEGK